MYLGDENFFIVLAILYFSKFLSTSLLKGSYRVHKIIHTTDSDRLKNRNVQMPVYFCETLARLMKNAEKKTVWVLRMI